MKHLYNNEFDSMQIAKTKKALRGQIFLLLLAVDPQTSSGYENVDVKKCFVSLLLCIGGLNELLLKQPEIVTAMSLLQAAYMEYLKVHDNGNTEGIVDISEIFNFEIYRKLILDAGAEIGKLREE